MAAKSRATTAASGDSLLSGSGLSSRSVSRLNHCFAIRCIEIRMIDKCHSLRSPNGRFLRHPSTTKRTIQVPPNILPTVRRLNKERGCPRVGTRRLVTEAIDVHHQAIFQRRQSRPCVQTMLCGNEHGESRNQFAITSQVKGSDSIEYCRRCRCSRGQSRHHRNRRQSMTIRDRRWGLRLMAVTFLIRQTNAFEAAIEAP